VGPKSIWLKYLTQESVPYYYNSRTHESTWLLPNNTNRSRVVEAGEVANDGVAVNEEDNQERRAFCRSCRHLRPLNSGAS
jgi:hypothetical protein